MPLADIPTVRSPDIPVGTFKPTYEEAWKDTPIPRHLPECEALTVMFPEVSFDFSKPPMFDDVARLLSPPAELNFFSGKIIQMWSYAIPYFVVVLRDNFDEVKGRPGSLWRYEVGVFDAITLFKCAGWLSVYDWFCRVLDSLTACSSVSEVVALLENVTIPEADKANILRVFLVTAGKPKFSK